MKKYGLIGYPLSHSFSPFYFEKKFTQEKIYNCSYTTYPIDNIAFFLDLIKKEEAIVGLNVTIPYKEKIIPFLTSLDTIAQKTQSVNCIKIKRNGNQISTSGFNTDVIGFQKSIEPLLKEHHKNALIFGNGGAAKSVKYVLESIGIKTMVISRSNNKFGYDIIDAALIKEFNVLINTTPLGMIPKENESVCIPFQFLTNAHLCYDLIYNPQKTFFLQKAEEQGAVIKNGLEMLTIQADESWKIWNDNSLV